MKKKAKRKKKPEAKKEKVPRPEAFAAPTEMPRVQATMARKLDIKKVLGVIVLLTVAILFAYLFLVSDAMFIPGSEVDVETFTDIFGSAEKVYIFMDVRGVNNDFTRTNILQCGVDFAASSGMAGKDVTYFSLGDGECIAPDGSHPPSYCFSQLENGITIYVKEGPGGADYYTNGMMVYVGTDYELGTCGIRRV